MPQQLPAVSLVAVPRPEAGHARNCPRDRTARLPCDLRAEPVCPNMSLCEALCHVADRIEFGTSIALSTPARRRFRANRRLHARGQRRAFPTRHRRQPRTGARAHGRDGRQAVGDMRGFVESLRARRHRRASSDRARHSAQEDGRARRRDRRRRGVGERCALAHGARWRRCPPQARRAASSSPT